MVPRRVKVDKAVSTKGWYHGASPSGAMWMAMAKDAGTVIQYGAYTFKPARGGGPPAQQDQGQAIGAEQRKMRDTPTGCFARIHHVAASQPPYQALRMGSEASPNSPIFLVHFCKGRRENCRGSYGMVPVTRISRRRSIRFSEARASCAWAKKGLENYDRISRQLLRWRVARPRGRSRPPLRWLRRAWATGPALPEGGDP